MPLNIAAVMAKVADATDPGLPLVNFLDPEELVHAAFERTRSRDSREETYTQQVAHSIQRERAERDYHAAVADRKRRHAAKEATRRLKIEKARVAKAKKKKMKKKGR